MKKIAKLFLNAFGLELRRKPAALPVYDYYRNEMMIKGLAHAKQRGLEVNSIVDIGAAEGSWSLSAAEYWPEARYVLFEPLLERKDLLEKLCSKHKNFQFVSAAAGKSTGEVKFHISSDLDGSGVIDTASTGNNIRAVKVTSIDLEVERLKLKGPFIIKLDTHGYEVPIIDGCSAIMNEVSLFIIECYGFQIAKDSLLFWEMCRLMNEKGFRLVDIVDIINRPKDHAFWQCDAFFVPAHLDIFQNNSYA